MINLADEAMTIKLDYDLPEYPKMEACYRSAPRRESHLTEADKALAIKVKFDEKGGFAGDKVTFDYTVTGADETTKVYVEHTDYVYTLDKENNKLYVNVPTAEDKAEYLVLKAVRNSDGKSSAQCITVVLESRYGTFGGVIIKDENPYKDW